MDKGQTMNDIPEGEDEFIKPTIKTAKLGHSFSQEELKEQCKCIYGGVSWPGKNPGFAVVVGMSVFRHIGLDSYDVCLLDEYESHDIRELVRQCGVLNYKYQPEKWVGDTKNQAAGRFITEMNKQYEHSQQFRLTSTQMLEMGQDLYSFICPELKGLKESKQLLLKSSRIFETTTIEPSEVATMELGEYPAIEALAFAVIEMRNQGDKKSVTDADIKRWQKKYGRR